MDKNKRDANGRTAIIVSSVLLIFFTLLLLYVPRITGPTYFGLITLSFFVGIITYFKNHISVIDIRNLRIILEKTKKVKSEIDKIALDLARIVANLSSYSSGTWENRKKLNDEIETLLKNTETSEREIEEILHLPRIVEKGMRDSDSISEIERKEINQMLGVAEDKGSSLR